MTTQRYGVANQHAGKIIAVFLERTSVPSTQDWKRLMAEHPQHAADIADAAMLSLDAHPLVEDDVEHAPDKDAYERGVSKALDLLHSMPSSQLADAQKKVMASSGPSVRKLASQVGLGAAPPLLSGVLAGSIVAPKQTLQRLAEKFETSVMALAEVFTRAFAAQELPAFKAENGKPRVLTAPTPWKDAVKASGLPQEQVRELLKLDE